MRIAIVSLIFLALVNAEQPKLFIKERAWNFGTIKQHKTTTHDFVISNVGREPLIIKRIRTTCGCTAALSAKKRIEPGESGKINVTFSPGYRKGRVTKYVYIESNDSDEPLVKLTVTGLVEILPSPIIRVTPTAVDLGILWADSKIKTTIDVENRGVADLIIEAIEPSPNSEIKVITALDTLPVGDKGTIDILYEPNISYKSIYESIKDIQNHIIIRSNDPRRPEMWIPVKGYIAADPWLYAIYSRILAQVPYIE